MLNMVKATRTLVVFAAVVGMIGASTLLSNARPPSAAITIVNNSSREIRSVYLSPDQTNWGPDQLGNSVIAAGGGSATINANCNGSVKVIAEDHEGCFFYSVVSCEGDSTWTIASDAVPDCGN